jgi:hypothetical protein
MGLPWYRVHPVVLNDLSHLLFIHTMHTTLVVGWTGSTAIYKLVIFDLSNSVLDPMYVCYTFHDSFRNNQFIRRLEYHRRDYNKFEYFELRRCGRCTYCVFLLVLFGSYLELGVLRSRNIL